MTVLTRILITAEMNRLGYKVFTTGNYNLNIVGIRILPGAPNKFDDWITCFYQVDSQWKFHAWPATTDPGLYWLEHPGRITGTAIVQPGQYKSCWKLGLHHTSYEALVQAQPEVFKVWRDRNLDGQVDYTGPTYVDAEGINLHHAGTTSTRVDKWSAGCQVIANITDWNEFIQLPHKQLEAGMGSTFSYTLIELK